MPTPKVISGILGTHDIGETRVEVKYASDRKEGTHFEQLSSPTVGDKPDSKRSSNTKQQSPQKRVEYLKRHEVDSTERCSDSLHLKRRRTASRGRNRSPDVDLKPRTNDRSRSRSRSLDRRRRASRCRSRRLDVEREHKRKRKHSRSRSRSPCHDKRRSRSRSMDCCRRRRGSRKRSLDVERNRSRSRSRDRIRSSTRTGSHDPRGTRNSLPAAVVKFLEKWLINPRRERELVNYLMSMSWQDRGSIMKNFNPNRDRDPVDALKAYSQFKRKRSKSSVLNPK